MGVVKLQVVTLQSTYAPLAWDPVGMQWLPDEFGEIDIVKQSVSRDCAAIKCFINNTRIYM